MFIFLWLYNLSGGMCIKKPQSVKPFLFIFYVWATKAECKNSRVKIIIARYKQTLT